VRQLAQKRSEATAASLFFTGASHIARLIGHAHDAWLELADDANQLVLRLQ
jgi:hypothetical protein